MFQGYGFITRKMVSSHFDWLIKIEQSSSENFWRKPTFEKHLMRRNCGGIVVCDSMAPVGYLAYEKCPAESLIHILNLVVDAKFRRRGVGRLLLDKAKEMLCDQYVSVRLNVRESNLPSQLFLKNYGFTAYAIALNYFIDKYPDRVLYENGYCFHLTPLEERRNEPIQIRIVDRLGTPVANFRNGKRTPVHDGDGCWGR